MAPTRKSRKSARQTAPPDIPDKLYFRIGEVSRLLDLPSYVLRFWETEFPQLKPTKSGTGQRLYRRSDVDTLLLIRRLLYDDGFTIPGARQHLKEHARPPEPTAIPLTMPAADTAPALTLETLHTLQAGLRDIAALLGQPVGTAHGLPSHRGLHTPATRRVPQQALPSLFLLQRNQNEDGHEE